MSIRAWQCPECSALISESVIGDPADEQTRVRCHECGDMVWLSIEGQWFPEERARELLAIEAGLDEGSVL